MRDGVAVVMKVETLLSDGRRDQYERPEWRVERRTYGALSAFRQIIGKPG